ncbi:MAG: LysR family transcriptional regulator [Burkholderiaceae bacterium]
MDIRNIDLNLLPILDALLRCGSVTQAAQELDMSQSAVSSALARLRTLFDDQLLVRSGRGMLPTPRALKLAGPLGRALAMARDELFTGQRFDPLVSDRSFVICHSDVGAYVLWPRIVAAVEARAPRASLNLRVLGEPEIAAGLESGELDVAIGVYPSLPVSLYQRRLFEREFVLLMREGHPLADARITANRFAAARHLIVRRSSGVQDQVDVRLHARGLRRDRVIDVPTYLMLPPLLEASDYVVVLPGQLADAFKRVGRFVSRPIPLETRTSVIRLHWHRRNHEDAANRWLRELVVELFSADANSG